MKITIISFFAILFVVSCNTNDSDVTTKYIAQLEAENKSLKKELELLKIDVLTNKQEAEIVDVDVDVESDGLVDESPIEFSNETLKNFDSLFAETDYVEFVRNDLFYSKLFLDKEGLLRFIYNFLRFDEQSILGRFLHIDLFWTNSNGVSKGDIDPANSESQFSYLWNKIDRSPENIKKLISEKDKQFLYSLFKGNNFYKKSGVQSMVEGLLLSYSEINETEWMLDKFQNFPQKHQYQYVIVKDAISEDMLVVLADYNYSFYNENTDIDQRAYYVYSFWARRFNEGNSELVYQMLQDFHDNVVK